MRWLILVLNLLPSTTKANEVCVAVPEIATDPKAPAALVEIYEEVFEGLQRFPSMLTTLNEQSPELCLSDKLDSAVGFFEVERNRIYLSSQVSKALQAGVLLHEVRHLEQATLGICPSDALAMEEYARATFALEADASAVALLIAWDMKEHGNSGPWAALSAWPTQSDIALEFAAEMSAVGDIPTAVSTAFDQWFQSESRLEDYYITTCSEFLDRQDSSHSLPRYQLVPADFLDNLCRLPDGSEYECALQAIHRP